MAEKQARLSDVDRSNLVAYLDGELDEMTEQSLATKLTQSVSGRREADALQKTWELLDYLPRPKAPEDFTTRTLTEIAQLDLKGTELASAAGKTARRLVAALACAATLLLTLGVGYVSTRWLWPDPTARLARDLSLAEHYDEYRDVGSFQFLELLDQSDF